LTVVADLHCHTTITDGLLSPTELIDTAARVGLRSLVITDHSAVTFTDIRDYASQAGIEMPFPGIEVSTFLGGSRYHLLLYGPALTDPRLQQQLEWPLRWKREIARQVCRELARGGHLLPSAAEITALGTGPGRATPGKRYPSRTQIAWHLAAAAGLPQAAAYQRVVAVYRDIDERDCSDRGRLARRYLPVLDVLDMAVSCGATAVLAHPFWECASEADLPRVLRDVTTMAAVGLRGVECRSYHHRMLDDHPALLRAMADLGLIRGGGSDFHGNGKTKLGGGGLGAVAFQDFARIVAVTATCGRTGAADDPEVGE
jgi:3',5'-nucleoside bisphosphate phosphatase